MKGAFKSQLSVLALLILLCNSCSAGNPLQKEFGVDSEYFLGLTLLKSGQENEARSKFHRCIKKGSPQCVRKSYEILCTFGSVQEKNQAAIAYNEKYKDADSLLLAARQLKSAGEISKVIEITQNCNLIEDNNEVIKCRMESLAERKASSLDEEVFTWFMNRPISAEHYQFYRDTYEHPESPEDFTPQQFVLDYRIELYKRNYSYTAPAAITILDYFEKGTISPNTQLASDIGKACLFGSTNFAENATLFAQLAEQYKDTPLEYFMWFYAGRLFEKTETYFKQSISSFEKAVQTAPSPAQKDTALWYLLVSSLSFSLETITQDIATYSRQWQDPVYFEDFFESLISGLLASGNWNAFGEIYKSIDGYASDLTVAQYAYIYGRLIQEKLARGTKEDAEKAFRRALRSSTSPYYKVLAAHQLGLSGQELEKTITTLELSPKKIEYKEANLDAEKLLKGYAYFGFPELIYPTWQKLYKNGISDETTFFLANFLNRCSTGNDDYYQQALRMSTKTLSNRTIPLSKEELMQIFPKNYSKFIEEYSEHYEVPNSIIYAMVRSESFFDPDIQSSAGAIGLTQLMEFTGSDIARKLKVQNYELTDPETNLHFGIYYLSELIRRCDGSLLQGFFSYNAGITRVRRWVQSSMIEFGKKEKMPVDLFLETVPYAETREYGRKLAGAAAMYAYLYNDDSDQAFNDIIGKMVSK